MSKERPEPGGMLSKAILSHAELGSNARLRACEKSDLWQRARAWWKHFRRLSQRRPRRLRLCESLPLGERRFVAVVEFERSRFLVGGTPASLVLLAQLGNVPDKNQERYGEHKNVIGPTGDDPATGNSGRSQL